MYFRWVRHVALHQPARTTITTGDNDDDVGAPAWWACFDHRFSLHSCCLHGTNRVDPVHSAHTWVPEATFSLVRNAQQLCVLIPIYLGFIHVFTTRSTTQCCSLLLRDIRRQLDFAFGPQDTPRRRASTDVLRMLAILLVLTVALTVPSVSWFLAVPLTSMANITSIYNTFSLWAVSYTHLTLPTIYSV